MDRPVPLRGERAVAGPARERSRCGLLAALHCRRGGYLLEFAWIATGLLTMLFGAVEMAWQAITAVAMENAMLEASRTGSLGCPQPDGTRAGKVGVATLTAAAKAAGAGFLNDTSLTLQPLSYGSLGAAMTDMNRPAGNPSSGIAGGGGSGQTVVYSMTYNQPLLFARGLLGRQFYTHKGTIVIKNEPFLAGGAGATTC